MKKIILFCCLAALLAGCKNWIDVSPRNEVKSKDLFNSEDGFKSALIGIYGRMTLDETYGQNLTYGFIEQLVQRYDNYRPGQVVTDQQRADIYDYTNNDQSTASINTIWNQMYTNIANINNLIYNLNQNGDQILLTPGYRNMIEGEAYALRALHYFDLLRLWGPVYSDDPTADCVPWRDQFTSEKVPLMAADELMGKILLDLHHAEEMLADDPMDMGTNPSDRFLGERRFRMNLYAVKALLARVYLYAGDTTKAAQYAKDVIDNCGMSLVDNNRTDVAMRDECLFCLDMFNMEERVSSSWKNTTEMDQELWISTENIRSVFEYYSIGINDIRYKNNYGFIHGNNRYMCRKYLGTDTYYKNVVPMIRLGEMYLIMAESVGPDQCAPYLNRLRNVRGISQNNNIGGGIDQQQMLDLLNREYQKEFFAEGQWFYFLKRHNMETFHRSPVETMTYYTLPIPDDEVEFGDVVQ